MRNIIRSRRCRFALVAAAVTVLASASVARGWTQPPPVTSTSSSSSSSRAASTTTSGRGRGRGRVVVARWMSDDVDEPDDENVVDDPKTKMAGDLRRLFDIHEMAYTVMIREESKGSDGKLTPDELVRAIEKDGMFGEDLEEYRSRYCSSSDDDDVKILEIGKCADDGLSSEPIPPDDDGSGFPTIPGTGTYLVHLSFAEDVLATMRVVVD